MFKINDYIIYKRDVCKIIGLKDPNYVLTLLEDPSLLIMVPFNSDLIREISSKDKMIETISKFLIVKPITCDNDKIMEQKYKELLKDYREESLLVIMKTAFLRNKSRINNKRKIGEKDEYYFNLAEKFLDYEIAISLNISYDEAKKMVFEKLNSV